MNFLSDQVKKFSEEKPEETSKPGQGGAKPQSSGDLMTSAKVVADAAQAAARKETDKLDKGKVAGAGADLLGAASEYGKLDDKSGVGQYVDKAEKYLHQYESSHSSTGTAAPPAAGEPAAKGGDKDSGSGLGDYAKMAQGFLK